MSNLRSAFAVAGEAAKSVRVQQDGGEAADVRAVAMRLKGQKASSVQLTATGDQ